ncbi:MAG: lysoplasmalogenase, partial [Lysobacter sp.]
MDAEHALKRASKGSTTDATMEAMDAGSLQPRAGSRLASARWLGLVAIAAALAIVSAYLPLLWLHYVAKPLATLLIVAMVWSARSSERGYSSSIIVGLLLSTCGDVFLMLPGDYFVFGLASFLLAHVAYLFAFARRERLFAVTWPFLAYGAMAALVLSVLWPGLPQELRVPVIVYVVVLAAMAAQAAVVWRMRRDRTT